MESDRERHFILGSTMVSRTGSMTGASLHPPDSILDTPFAIFSKAPGVQG